MDTDDTLRDFLQVLGRIADLAGEALMSDDEEIDLVATIQKLRQSGQAHLSQQCGEIIALF